MSSVDIYQTTALFDCSQDLSTHGISSFNIQQNLLSDKSTTKSHQGKAFDFIYSWNKTLV